ncbi:MAG: hypothetical protein IIB88_08355, partial [Chloroflexi bacterium]|nr:hypothetical protein [Chloroflexota bacterium]
MTSYDAKGHYQQEEIASGYDAERFRGARGAFVDWLERRLLDQSMEGLRPGCRVLDQSMEGLRPGCRVLDLPVGTGRVAR